MPESIQNILALFVKEVKRVLGKDVDKVIVYGSYARGDYDENSDIDIMVLTSRPEEEIKPVEYALYDVAFDFFMEYDVDISVIVKNKDHFNYWLGALPFYDNVERGCGYSWIADRKIYAIKAVLALEEIDFKRLHHQCI